jgi:trigger factor
VKTSVERIDETKVKLAINLEPTEVDRAIDDAAKRLAHEVKVPGFRPGRVPRRVLESRLGKDALYQEAVRDALPVYYREAVDAEGLPVVSDPEFDVDEFAPGAEATFTATVEVRPEVAPPDVSELQIPHPDWELTDKDLQGQIDELRERFATLEAVDRGADVGDYAVITITGTRNGERVDDASGEDLHYRLRDARETDSELDRQLVGAEPGAILKFTDTLGDDYGELAGAELDFTVIVKEVKAQRLPEFDDRFAQDASEFDTAEELREEVRRQLVVAKRAAARAELRGKVVEAVSDLVDVPLPDAMVQGELHFRLHQVAAEADRHGLSAEQYLQLAGQSAEDLYGRLEEDARRTVKAQLVIDAVGQAAGIEVDREDLGVEIARQAQRLGRDPEELAEFMTAPERIGALVSDAFRRKTIDHLLGAVQVLGGPPADEPLPEPAAGDLEGHEAEALVARAADAASVPGAEPGGDAGEGDTGSADETDAGER